PRSGARPRSSMKSCWYTTTPSPGRQPSGMAMRYTAPDGVCPGRPQAAWPGRPAGHGRRHSTTRQSHRDMDGDVAIRAQPPVYRRSPARASPRSAPVQRRAGATITAMNDDSPDRDLPRRLLDALAGLVEAALDRLLRLDPATPAVLQRLDGRELRLRLRGAARGLRLHVAGGRVRPVPDHG